MYLIAPQCLCLVILTIIICPAFPPISMISAERVGFGEDCTPRPQTRTKSVLQLQMPIAIPRIVTDNSHNEFGQLHPSLLSLLHGTNVGNDEQIGSRKDMYSNELTFVAKQTDLITSKSRDEDKFYYFGQNRSTANNKDLAQNIPLPIRLKSSLHKTQNNIKRASLLLSPNIGNGNDRKVVTKDLATQSEMLPKFMTSNLLSPLYVSVKSFGTTQVENVVINPLNDEISKTESSKLTPPNNWGTSMSESLTSPTSPGGATSKLTMHPETSFKVEYSAFSSTTATLVTIDSSKLISSTLKPQSPDVIKKRQSGEQEIGNDSQPQSRSMPMSTLPTMLSGDETFTTTKTISPETTTKTALSSSSIATETPVLTPSELVTPISSLASSESMINASHYTSMSLSITTGSSGSTTSNISPSTLSSSRFTTIPFVEITRESSHYTSMEAVEGFTDSSPIGKHSTTLATKDVDAFSQPIKDFTISTFPAEDSEPETKTMQPSTVPPSILVSTSDSIMETTQVQVSTPVTSASISNTNTHGNTNEWQNSMSTVMSTSSSNIIPIISESPSNVRTGSTFGALSPMSTTPSAPTNSQNTDKPAIDWSTSKNILTTSQSHHSESETISGKTKLDVETMSTIQWTSQTPASSGSSPVLETSTSSSSNDFICNVDQWLACDTSSFKCKCLDGMKYDEERATCVSKEGRECQNGSSEDGGKRLCIKNASCNSTIIGQVGVCRCTEGFLAGKNGDCVPGLGRPCVISNSSSMPCYTGMKCTQSGSNGTGSSCSCDDGWDEGKQGGLLRCFLNYNAKCDLGDNHCNPFTFLNCSDTTNECKCNDPSNQVYDEGVKACVAISGAKCMLKPDSQGRRLNCINNAECKLKSQNSSSETGNCECITEYENDWKGNCHLKNGDASSINDGMFLMPLILFLHYVMSWF